MSDPSIESSSELLKAILDTVVDGIITIDGQGTIQSLNPAAEKIFGYAADELTGQNVNALMPSPYHEEHDGYLDNYHRSRVPKVIGIGREVKGLRKDGSVFPLYLAVSEFEHEGRKYFSGIVRDITELKKYQDHLEELVDERTRQLEEAHEKLLRQERLAVLGQLSGSVAHEIRNPLGAIKNNVYYLKMVATDLNDEARSCITEIETELNTTNRIVTELLDYARQPQVDRRTFEIAEVVAKAIRNVEPEEGVTVTCHEPFESVSITADRVHVERVLSNLVQNAVQAIDGAGEVSISWGVNDGHVEISVKDDGAGIAGDNLEKIFEPLFTTKAKGIGLGLPLCKRYAELNDGQLTAESAAGKGTTFRLLLPQKH
jgi:two-component system, LuxR family, sensor kinase FixL